MSHVPECVTMTRIRVRLVQLLILHQHHRNSQIEQEETAHNDTRNEIEFHRFRIERIHVDVHHGGPAFHRDDLEDDQECTENVVEVSDAVVQTRWHRVSIQISHVDVAEFFITLEQAAAPRSVWTLAHCATESIVTWK